jgi:beta-lactamase regulating signal transducer with metallopeptidase domain
MSPWTHVVGWTLIHFVWEGAVLAVTAAIALRLCRHLSPNTRYVIACAVLATMLASPVISATVLMTPDLTVPAGVRVPQGIAAPLIVATGSRSWIDDRGLSIDAVWAGVDGLLPVIVFIWLAGVTVLLARMAGGLWHVRRLQVGSLAAPPSRWRAATERIASRLGLRVAIHVVESALVDAPMVVGWMRPVILLPIAALSNLTPAQVEAILAHELIHIRRHDYIVNVAQTVAETLMFFHPGVWWVSGQIRVEREHCCDDVAVQVCGDAVEYAAALAELEAWRSRGTTLALAAVNGSLTGRVRRLLKVPVGHEARSLSWVVTLGLTLVSAVVMGGVHVASSFGPGSGVPVVPAVGAQGVEPIASPDTFDWQVHETNHFDIHYYPALTPNLEQVADSAERAYQRISSELQYNLPFRVPLVLFKTRTDFAQQRIVPDAGGAGAIARGEVAAFSEHRRNRLVILVEEEPDRLYRLVTHELTHIFAFDIIPRSSTNVRRVAPWIDEGFAEYMTGVWDPDNLRQMRDLAMAGNVPKMSAVTGTGDDRSLEVPALGVPMRPQTLGHAVFEFIEAEYGKPAVWQFLIEVRRSVVDGATDLYERAFNRPPAEFDAAFAEYVRRRFSQ